MVSYFVVLMRGSVVLKSLRLFTLLLLIDCCGASPFVFLFWALGPSGTGGTRTHSDLRFVTTGRGFKPCTEGLTFMVICEKNSQTSMLRISRRMVKRKFSILEKFKEVFDTRTEEEGESSIED